MAEEIAQPKEIDEKTIYRREIVKRNIRDNIDYYEKRREFLHHVVRILHPKDNHIIAVYLRLGALPIFEGILKDCELSFVEILNQLMIDVDAGKFDECFEEAIARSNLQRKKNKMNRPYKLKLRVRRSLKKYPNIVKAIKKYINDKGITESGKPQDFVMFFKQVYHKYALKTEEIFPYWSKSKIKKFDSSDEDSRWKIVEDYIKKHFELSTIYAEYFAEDYGDAEVDGEGNIIDKGIDYLTKKQKQELFKYPHLRKYVNAYISDMYSYPNFSEYSDFTMFFKKQEFENCVSVEDMFPMWVEIDERVQKKREEHNNDSTTSDEDYNDEEYNYYEQFDNSGSHSRWMVVEEFIADEFSYCVDCAIKVAEEYGDINLYPEEYDLREAISNILNKTIGSTSSTNE